MYCSRSVAPTNAHPPPCRAMAAAWWRWPRGRERCAIAQCRWGNPWFARFPRRSEEHTSELQSRPHLVCRLLLEKKKLKEDSKSLRLILPQRLLQDAREYVVRLVALECELSHTVEVMRPTSAQRAHHTALKRTSE